MGIDVTKISDSIIEFTEGADFAGTGKKMPYVDAYLVIGKDKALAIDCLQSEKGLYEKMKEFTDLQIELLITHGHGDHAGAALEEFVDAGCKIYMAPVDFEVLLGMNPGAKKEWFTDLTDRMVFDIGGYKFETIFCGGHTPGSVVFLDREKQIMFSGDTVGSGSFWMQLPTSLPLGKFLPNVERLKNEVKSLDKLLLYPGHRNQSPVQLTGQYITDAFDIVKGVLDGSIVGNDKTIDFPGRHMEFKTVAKGQMLDFCYDVNKL